MTQISQDFDAIWPAIDSVGGFLIPGQERWLFNAALDLPDDAVIVEIGSFLGRSTTAMAFACRGTRRRIFAIDTFEGNSSDFIKGKNGVDWEGDNFLPVFERNLAQNDLLDYVTPVVGKSSDTAAAWDTPIDFLFIDGSHEFDDVVADFEKFFPWVKAGGLVALHDVQPAWAGPYRAWQEEIRSRLERPSHFFSIAYGRKPFYETEFSGTVHAIIPVHNRAKFTRGCLKTFETQVLRDRIEVHVVNDGSRDETATMLANEFPWVHVIEGDGNLWWTGAVAHALDTLKPRFEPGDYFLLVNNDVYLSTETVEILVRESLRLDRVPMSPTAICGSEAISTGWGNGTSPVLNSFERQFRLMNAQKNTYRVDSLFGRCSLYPVEVLDLIGNFDAKVFPHYHGDTDFGLRATKLGMPSYITGCTTIRVREETESTGTHHSFRLSPQSWAQVWENMTSPRSIDNVPAFWRYMDRHYPTGKYRKTIDMAWSSIRQWRPIYEMRAAFALPEHVRKQYTGLARFRPRALWQAATGLLRWCFAAITQPRNTLAKINGIRRTPTWTRISYYPRAVVYLLKRPALLRSKLKRLLRLERSIPDDDP